MRKKLKMIFIVRVGMKWTWIDDLICTYLRGIDETKHGFLRWPTSRYSLSGISRRTLRSVFTATLTARSSIFVNVLGNVRVDSIVSFGS